MKTLNLHPAWGVVLLYGVLASCACATPLSLPQALLLAENNNPVLRVASGQLHGAQASQDTAGAYPNPEIEFGSGNSHLLPGTGQIGRNRALTISQPLELPMVRNARQRAADAGTISSSALFDDARLNLYAQVKSSFFEVQRRQEEAQLAEQGRALLEQIRKRVKLKVEVGEASRYELVKADAETLAAENVLQGSRIRIRQAKDLLRTLIAAPLPDQIEITPTPVSKLDLPELDELRQELLMRQPLLKAANAETRRAEARLEHERSLRIPQPTLKWSTEQHPDVNFWRVSVALPFPVWDRRSGPVGEAFANLERAHADEDRIRLGLLSDLDQAMGRYQIAQRQLQTFESGLMRDAETAMKVAEAAYRYGERGILDYLDAQRVLRTTRLDFINARYELQAALIQIERLRATAGDLP